MVEIMKSDEEVLTENMTNRERDRSADFALTR